MVEIGRAAETGRGLVFGESGEDSEGLRLGETLVLKVVDVVARSGRGRGGSGVGMVAGFGSEIAGPEDVVLVELVLIVGSVDRGGGGAEARVSMAGGRR